MASLISIMMVVMMMMVGTVHAVHTGVDTNAAVAYWEERLQGASMPSTLCGMLTPLDAQQAAALRNQIVQHPNFLPSHAPALCEATRMQCDRPTYSQSEFSYVTEAHGRFFWQNVTLVSGAKIQVGADVDGDNRARAFLPRDLAHLFPITGKGGTLRRTASKLGIPDSALPSLEDNVAHCDGSTSSQGETKACISSIEDLADFAAFIMTSSQSHHNIIVLDSSDVPHMSVDATHTVLAVQTIKQDADEKYVACHDMLFPFRLFSCHYIHQTRVFLATIQAQDGSVYNRVAVCHYDTSSWDPAHQAFSDLDTKPGESEACHWVGRVGLCFVHQSSAAVL